MGLDSRADMLGAGFSACRGDQQRNERDGASDRYACLPNDAA